MLEMVRCDVRLDVPGWVTQIVITSGDTGDDVCAPVGPGMLWHQHPLRDESMITIIPRLTGLPESALALVPSDLSGRPLSSLVSHPILDPLGLVVRKVSVHENGRDEKEVWLVTFENGPVATSLAEAAAAYDEDTDAHREGSACVTHHRP